MYDVRPDLAVVAALLAEPSRAAILWSLMDGQQRPAGELARVAGLSAQAASAHLSKLIDGGLVAVTPSGRWRRYRLAGPDAAAMIEQMARFSSDRSHPPAGSVARLVPAELRFARSCYDHLAGRFAVELFSRASANGWLVGGPDGWSLSERGRAAFATLGVDSVELEGGKRPVIRECLDWTERTPHLAGALGAALLSRILERRWMERVEGGRALRLTNRGGSALGSWLNKEAAPVAKRG